jgi:hypothetical protein
VSPAQHSRLFSEVNDRIYELLEAAEPDLPGEFLCECGRECGRRVLLLPEEFARLRRSGEAVRSQECGGRVGLRDQQPRPADSVPALG